MFPITFNAIGDIIALIQLGIVVVKALASSRGARAAHDELTTRLRALLPVLCACEHDYESLSNPHHKATIMNLVAPAYTEIAKALNRLAKFKFEQPAPPGAQQSTSATVSRSSPIRTAWESLAWQLRGRANVSECLALLGETTGALTLALTAANGAHANRELDKIPAVLAGVDSLRTSMTATWSSLEDVKTSVQDAAAESAVRDRDLANVAASTNIVSLRAADDSARFRRDLSARYAAQDESFSMIQRDTREILGQGAVHTQVLDTIVIRVTDVQLRQMRDASAVHQRLLALEAGYDAISRRLDQSGTALGTLKFALLRCIQPRLKPSISGVVQLISASPISTRDVSIGCIVALVALAVSAPTATQQATYASYACLYVCVLFVTRLYKTPTTIHIVFVVDFFNDCSPLELAIKDARSPMTFHNAMLRHFHGKYGYTITMERMYTVVIKDNAADAGQPLPGSKSWAGLVRAGQRLFLDAMVRQASEESGVQLSCPSCGKPQPAGCMEAQRLMKCAVCPVSFGQVKQADFTPVTEDDTSSFSEIDRVASLEDELNRCKRIMVLTSLLRTEDQGVEQAPESRASRSVPSGGGRGGGGGFRSQGYVQRLHDHYQGLRLAPQTYIQYDMQPVEGSTYVATVWLRNFNPPSYYVGRGISKMAAQEAAAYSAGRALGLP